MARGSADAKAGAATGVQNAKTYGTNAQGLYNTLAPSLTAEALHPPGMSEKDLAAANTATQQSAGGSQSAAVGQGGLLAARTRNAGGADAAIADAARSGGEHLAQGALETQIKNAALKEQQRRAATGEMGQLEGQQIQGGNAALGASAAETNADVNASNASWNWLKPIQVGLSAFGPMKMPGMGQHA